MTDPNSHAYYHQQYHQHQSSYPHPHPHPHPPNPPHPPYPHRQQQQHQHQQHQQHQQQQQQHQQHSSYSGAPSPNYYYNSYYQPYADGYGSAPQPQQHPQPLAIAAVAHASSDLASIADTSTIASAPSQDGNAPYYRAAATTATAPTASTALNAMTAAAPPPIYGHPGPPPPWHQQQVQPPPSHPHLHNHNHHHQHHHLQQQQQHQQQQQQHQPPPHPHFQHQRHQQPFNQNTSMSSMDHADWDAGFSAGLVVADELGGDEGNSTIDLATDMVDPSLASSACPSCGMDAQGFRAHVQQHQRKIEKTKRRIALQQEKFQLDLELLKQDKLNLKRRMKAAKAAVRSQQEAAQQQAAEMIAAAAEQAAALTMAAQASAVAPSAVVVATTSKSTITADVESINSNDNATQADSALAPSTSPVDPTQQQSALVLALQAQLAAALAEITLLQKQLLLPKETNITTTPAYELDSSMKTLQLENEREVSHETTTTMTASAVLSSWQTQYQLAHALAEQRYQQIVAQQAELEQLRNQYDRVVSLQQEHQQNKDGTSHNANDVASTEGNYSSNDDNKTTTLSSLAATVSTAAVSKAHRLVMSLEWYGRQVSGVYTGYIDSNTQQPDGIGTLQLEDGSLYHGHWKQGQYHGPGVLATIDGDLHQGLFFQGVLHGGPAVSVSSDGKVYWGRYEHGKKHQLVDVVESDNEDEANENNSSNNDGDGDTSKEKDSGSKRHHAVDPFSFPSTALMAWPFRAHYQGPFVQDKRQGGVGRYTYPDGRCYIGQYDKDRPHGYGTMRAADGATILMQGMWELGEFMPSSNKKKNESEQQQ